MSFEFGHAVFDWGFVSVMTSRSVIVLAIANTLGAISDSGRLPFRIGRLMAAFLASLIVTIYAAVQGGWSWSLGALTEVLSFSFILFCISAGMNQSVSAIGKRVTAGRGAMEAGRPEGGWWASWM